MTDVVENKQAASIGATAFTDPTKTAENTQTENPQDINWKKFRENRDKERKEREELERDRSKKEAENSALRAALEALANKPSPTQDQPEETEEQRIRRQVKEAVIEEQRTAEEARKKKEAAELPQRLQQSFTDFDSICNNENLDYLEFHYPEIAAPYRHLPDSFDKWSNIYKAVKRFVPNPNSTKDQKKAEKNFNKPQSMAVPGSTMTTDTPPTVLDDKRKESNWLRMQRRMKGLSG